MPKTTKLGACTLKAGLEIRPISFKEGQSYVYETTVYRSRFTIYPDYNDTARFVEITEAQFTRMFTEEQ